MGEAVTKLEGQDFTTSNVYISHLELEEQALEQKFAMRLS